MPVCNLNIVATVPVVILTPNNAAKLLTIERYIYLKDCLLYVDGSSTVAQTI